MKQTSQPREDLRQRRTRKLLADALLSLLEERPRSEIAVGDIEMCIRDRICASAWSSLSSEPNICRMKIHMMLSPNS